MNSARFTPVLVAVCFAALAGLGFAKLTMPFCGDTAMFFTAAEKIAGGGTLYLDFWDFKQPGIYWFFLAAGRLFGFSQMSMRLFELAWQLAFAAVMIGCLWRYYRHTWLAAVAPLAGLGSYYAVASDWELTQVEIVIAGPIFVSAWLLARVYATPRSALVGYAASGVMAAVAVVFKLAIAPIFVVFVLLAALASGERLRMPAAIARLFRIGVPYTAGVAVVLGIVVAVHAAQGSLGVLLWSTFVFPSEAFRHAALAPGGRIVASAVWFTGAMAPWLFFALVGVPAVVRRDEPLLSKLMLAWLVCGFGVIVLQRFSWWNYHFLLLFVPTAILGVRTIDRLLADWTPRLAGSVSALALGLLLVIPSFGVVVRDGSRHLQQLVDVVIGQGHNVEIFREAISEDYDKAATEAAVIGELGNDDERPIYVFGSPLLYVLSGRDEAIPINGWGWEYNLPEQWAELADDLARSRPEFIHLDDYYVDLLKQKSPATADYLDRAYVVVWRGDDATLYRATDDVDVH